LTSALRGLWSSLGSLSAYAKSEVKVAWFDHSFGRYEVSFERLEFSFAGSVDDLDGANGQPVHAELI
jgi:hypothetical protein